MINYSSETRKLLEELALEVRDSVNSFDYRKFKPPSKDGVWGKCGYAAKIVSQNLQEIFEPEKINIYTISDGFHTIAVLGSDFDGGWKIDPTIGQFKSVKDKNKLIFRPYEKYPLIFARHPSGRIVKDIPKIVHHKYFYNV